MNRSGRDQGRRAGIYVRISKWEGEGQSLGTQRQERECRALAKQRAWRVVEVYTDDDRSAFSGKRRPAYERLCEDLKAGTIDALVGWDSDRFYRRMRDVEDLVDLIDATGAALATVTTGTIDLSTVNGRAMARMAAVMGQAESEHKSERLRSKHAELREQGRPNGGNRPFGYRRVGAKLPNGEDTRNWSPEPDEAPIVVEIVTRLAAGETLTRVADDLNERGIPTAKGAKGWTLPNVRRVAVNPIYIGRRTHQGRDVAEGTWPAIVDEATWRRAENLLNAEDRPKRRSARRYLLTGGLIVCGRCGHQLRSKPHHSSQGLVATYACPPTKQGGCGGVSVRAEEVEELVTANAIDYIESPAFARVLRRREGNDPKVGQDISRIEARRDELARAYAAGSLSMREWITARDALDARQVEAQARLTTDTSTAAVGRYAGRAGTLRSEWEGKTLDQRQAILRAVGTEVTVAPVGKRGGRVFDPDRVVVDFTV